MSSYRLARPQQDLRSYARHVVETLLRDLAYGLRGTLERTTPQNVHDLRRVCLRLRHALRLFGGLLPPARARKVRRRLGEVQDLLGTVRVCDVAQELLEQPALASSLSGRSGRLVLGAVATRRGRETRPLRGLLRRLQRADTLRRWRSGLLGGEVLDDETPSETAG